MMTDNKFQILIVDDSEVVLNQMSVALKAAGHAVFTTTQTYAAHRFVGGVQLAIIDFYMPGIGGAALVKLLRTTCETTNPSCLFYLSTSDESVARDYKKYGFDGAFGQKGNMTALVAAVSSVAKIYALKSGAGRPKT